MRNYHLRINCPRRKLLTIVLHPTELFISIAILAKIFNFCELKTKKKKKKKKIMTKLYIIKKKNFFK